LTQEEKIDFDVQEAIAGSHDEDPDDESTWHEDPDPTHRGFDWHMLFIGLMLAAVLAWSAHKQETIRHDRQGIIHQGLC
jgi:hypothetical protein